MAPWAVPLLPLVLVLGLGLGGNLPSALSATNESPLLVTTNAPFAKGPARVIDLTHRVLVLETRQGPRTFSWTDTTYIFRADERVTAEKIKLGDIVAVRFEPGPGSPLPARRMKVYPADQPAGETNQPPAALPPLAP